MRFISRFSTGLLACLLVSCAASSVRADPASELEEALGKLRQNPYRKRDLIDTPSAAPIKIPPVVTECSGDLERMIFDLDIPSIGTLRQERIKTPAHAAIRTSSPALVAKFSEMNRNLTVNSARNLLHQIVSVASAVQTGGLSTARWIMEAARAAATIKTTAEARAALQQASAAFGSWQLLDSDEDDSPPTASRDSDFMTVEREPGSDPTRVRYVRRPTMNIPGASFHSVITVDLKTGFPVAEESYVNGRRIQRTEFFDLGAPIVIDLPDCLK